MIRGPSENYSCWVWSGVRTTCFPDSWKRGEILTINFHGQVVLIQYLIPFLQFPEIWKPLCIKILQTSSFDFPQKNDCSASSSPLQNQSLHGEGKIRPLMSPSSQGLIFGNGISFGYFLFPSLCYFCIFILFLSWRVFQTLDPIFSFLNFSNIRSSHPGCLPWVSVSFLLVWGAGREENCFQAKQQCHSGDHLAGCAAWEWISACNA